MLHHDTHTATSCLFLTPHRDTHISHIYPFNLTSLQSRGARWKDVEIDVGRGGRVSGASFCSAGSRSPSFATGRAIIINIICLHHSPSTFAFSCRYEDGMLINEHGRHSAIRPVPRPPSAPSLCVPLQPSIPKRDGRPICFPASPPSFSTPVYCCLH